MPDLVKAIWLWVILVAIPGITGANSGLHNSTKQFTPPVQMSASDWSDPSEMERAWQAALVRIPSGGGLYFKTSMSALTPAMIAAKKRFPTVIYLHGCSGVWSGTHTRMDFLAKNGFAVIAPASLARQKYPKSCDVETHRGGLYRGTLRMRQYDAGYAIVKARALPWVDPDNLFLMGFSQGAITTATFSSGDPNAVVNARVVEGWTCNAGWGEYRGINAPDTEPVLTLVAKGDPWFQSIWTQGDCGEFINKDNGSRSIVYDTEPLSSRHGLLEDEAVRKSVLDFLRLHVR